MNSHPTGPARFFGRFKNYIFIVLLLGLTIFFLTRNFDMGEMLATAAGARLKFILPAVGLVLLFLFSEASAIRFAARPFGYRFSLLRGAVYACTDFFFASLTPSASGGQPAVVYAMARNGIPPSDGTVAILSHTFCYKIVTIILGLLVITLNPSLFALNGAAFIVLFFFGIAANAAMLAAIFISVVSKTIACRIAHKLVLLLAFLRVVKDPVRTDAACRKQIEAFRAGGLYIKAHPAVLLRVFLCCAVQRLALFTVPYMVFLSLGGSGYSYPDILTTQAAVALAVDSLPLPGAIGAAEGMFLVLYNRIYGRDLVVPAMLLSRGLNYYFCLVICSAVSLTNQLRKPRVYSRS